MTRPRRLCRISVVISEPAAKPVATCDASLGPGISLCWDKRLVLETLMVSLDMVVLDVLAHRRAKMILSQVILQLFHAFNCRSNTYSLVTLGVCSNKPLLWAAGGSALLQAGLVLLPGTQDIFGLAPLEAELWIVIFGVGILPLLAMEAWKMMRRP